MGVPHDVRLFGAKCDWNGTSATDDTIALNAAFEWSGRNSLPVSISGQCYTATGVFLPGHSSIIGVGYTASNPYTGPAIVCGLTASPCVKETSGGRNDPPWSSVRLEKIQITRAPGIIPRGAIGILIYQAQHVEFVDVIANRHDQCYRFFIHEGGPIVAYPSGYGAVVERGFTFQCQDTYMSFVGWDEVKIHNHRFGYVNAPDFAANAIFRVTGGTTSCPAGFGPNSIFVDQSFLIPFTKSPGTVRAVWQFTKLSNNLDCTPAVLFKIVNSHIENICSLLWSDASVNRVQFFTFSDSTFYANESGGGCTSKLFDLAPVTQVFDWFIHDNFISLGGGDRVKLAPTAAIKGLYMRDNEFGSNNVSIVAPANSYGTVCGNSLSGNTVSITGAGAAELRCRVAN